MAPSCCRGLTARCRTAAHCAEACRVTRSAAKGTLPFGAEHDGRSEQRKNPSHRNGKTDRPPQLHRTAGQRGAHEAPQTPHRGERSVAGCQSRSLEALAQTHETQGVDGKVAATPEEEIGRAHV